MNEKKKMLVRKYQGKREMLYWTSNRSTIQNKVKSW